MILIDPPSVFESLSEWQAFRARMVALKADHPEEAGEMIELADAEIKRMTAETK